MDIQAIIDADYRQNTLDVVKWRHLWRKIANWTEGISHLFLGISSILAFAAGFYGIKTLVFLSGCSSTACLVFKGFSMYANKESTERNVILNRMLESLALKPVPDIAADLDTPV